MTIQALTEFFTEWNNYNTAYSLLKPGRHIAFPDTILKDAIIAFIDNNLIINSGISTYDFKNNIEL